MIGAISRQARCWRMPVCMLASSHGTIASNIYIRCHGSVDDADTGVSTRDSCDNDKRRLSPKLHGSLSAEDSSISIRTGIRTENQSRRYSASGSDSDTRNGSQIFLRHWGAMLDAYEVGTGHEKHVAADQRRLEAREHLKQLLRVFGPQVHGGLVPEVVTRRFCQFYAQVLRPEDREWFFRMVCSELGLEVTAVHDAVKQWQAAVDRSAGSDLKVEMLDRSAGNLASCSRPLYTQMLGPISQLEGGIGFLVRMREHLLSVIRQKPAFAGQLRTLSEHLKVALASWFSLGLLQVSRLTWDHTSGHMLEKVMQYEAVHPIANWDDLKRRLHPADRRVYAFMHACMPTEPLVILHTALTCRPATALRELLPSYASGGCATRTATPCPGGSSSSSSSSSTRQGLEGGVEDTEQPAVAVFYSISSTQPGLSGVDLGHFLIKKAAELVKAEFPSVNLLVTLSPLPNFRRWLTARLKYEIEVNKSNGNASHSEERAAASTGMTSARARQRPPKWLLSEEDACGLLDAAALLPSSSLHKLNQALGGELPESPIDQGQRCRLLAAWLSTDLWHAPEQESGVDSTFRRLLLRLAARFLVCERRRNLCLDPVANFHLRNGAQLFKLHWAADCSDRGLSNSFGIMVSYRYDTELVHARNHQYLVDRTVAVADDVAKLLHEPQE